jgi:hypothetical protein
MTLHVVRSLGAFAAASAIVAVAGASVAASTGTTEPTGGAAVPGCTELVDVLDAVDAFAAGLFSGQLDVVEPLITAIPELGSAAAAAAPPEIAEAVATWVEPFPDIAAALADVDLADLEAAGAALADIDTEASDAARAEVAAWATDNCGYVQPDPLGGAIADAPEPPECETLDAAAAAEAAGIDVDVDDLDGSADVNLPGFWTKSCSYGNGAMSLSTLGFNDIEDAQQFYADNLDVASGVVLDVAVGALPESSLVIQTGVATGTTASAPGTDEAVTTVTPTVQVAVFEAPIPFSVSFTGDDIDAADVVAAAEAVLAAVSTGTQPATTDVATTA